MLQILTIVTLLIATITGPNFSAPPEPKIISIAEARSLPLGTIVTITGSVTVSSGAFSSSTFDQGFAIQDRTGGIYVSTADNLGFAPRQQVRVTGRLADTVLCIAQLVHETIELTDGLYQPRFMFPR